MTELIDGNKWVDQQIIKEWNNPEFRKYYIEATQEIYDETGLDTFDEIEELDRKYLKKC